MIPRHAAGTECIAKVDVPKLVFFLLHINLRMVHQRAYVVRSGGGALCVALGASTTTTVDGSSAPSVAHRSSNTNNGNHRYFSFADVSRMKRSKTSNRADGLVCNGHHEYADVEYTCHHFVHSTFFVKTTSTLHSFLRFKACYGCSDCFTPDPLSSPFPVGHYLPFEAPALLVLNSSIVSDISRNLSKTYIPAPARY